MKMIRSALVACLLALSGAFQAYSAEVFEDFNDWPQSIPMLSQATNDNWVGHNIWDRSRGFGVSPVEAVCLNGDASAYLRTPLLTNGYGTASFETARENGSAVPFYIQVSTNGLDPWTTIAARTNTAGVKVWNSWSVDLNGYEDAYLRVTQGGSTKLGFDNFRIGEPPAKVDFGEPYTDPEAPEINQSADVYCTITPSLLATITSTKLIYEIAGEYTTNLMTNVSNYLYVSASPIPAQSTAGVTVNYQIYVTLTGTNALSPAVKSTSYVVASKPFESDYAPMEVIDDASIQMTLVSNGLWRGIVSVASPLTPAEFRFQGSHTNGTTTNIWGDADQGGTSVVVNGTAGLSEAAITGPDMIIV